MPLNPSEQIHIGHVLTKFLLENDIDSFRLMMQTLTDPVEKTQAMWGIIIVQGGAMQSLAQAAGVDVIATLNSIIAELVARRQ